MLSVVFCRGPLLCSVVVLCCVLSWSSVVFCRGPLLCSVVVLCCVLSWSSLLVFDVSFGAVVTLCLRRVYEPRSEKAGLRGFRPGPTQTRLYSHRRWLEI